jgi:hypothetical protein
MNGMKVLEHTSLQFIWELWWNHISVRMGEDLVDRHVKEDAKRRDALVSRKCTLL